MRLSPPRTYPNPRMAASRTELAARLGKLRTELAARLGRSWIDWLKLAAVCLLSVVLALDSQHRDDSSEQHPTIFEISERWRVLVDNRALDAATLAATWDLLQASLKQSGWEAVGSMGHVAPISEAGCAQLEIVGRLRGHAAAFPRCAAPRIASCRYLTIGFADAVPPAASGQHPGLVALASLHEQWAANWAGEIAFVEDSQGRQSHPHGGALAFLPRPGRALLFDAEAPFSRHPPTRYAQPERRQQQPGRLSFPAESGVAHLLEVSFACEAPAASAAPPRPPPPPAPSVLPPGHLRGGERWAPLRSGGARLAYSASEHLLLFDRAWPAEAQERLTALAKGAIWSPRRRERSDGSSLRYHDAIPLSFEGANAIFDELRLARLVKDALECDSLALDRSYWNVQSYVDMNEPHQDANEVEPAAEAVTALVYPHARWEPEWAGHTVFLTPALDDVLYQAAPLPRRLLLFSGTIPHFARPATHAARPFAAQAAASPVASADEAVEADAHWARAHARVSLAFKLTCERSAERAQRSSPRRGACGSRSSSEAMGEATSFLLPRR